MQVTETRMPTGSSRLQQRLVDYLHRSWVWPLSVIILGFGTMLIWLPYLDAPLDVDVGTYATVAYWWAQGDGLYEKITADRPQGIFLVFRVIDILGFGTVRGIHLFAAIYASCCTLALLFLVRRVWGRAIGLLAASIFSLIMATPYLQGPTANAELFMLLPLLLSLHLLVCADSYPLGSATGGRYLLGSGLLGAVALLMKPPGLTIVVLGVFWLARRWRSEGAPWRSWCRAEAALVGGFLGGLIPAVLHGLAVAPDRYFYAIFLYRFSTLSAAAIPLSVQVFSLVSVALYIIVSYPVLLLTPLGLSVLRRDACRRDILVLWLATSFLGAAMGGNWFPHYFQQLLPPLTVAVALALRTLFFSPHRSRFLPLLRITTILSLLYLASLVGYILLPSANPSRLVIDHTHTPMATREVAAYLRLHTDPQESVYVAYGQGDIYYLSQRRPAARWLHTNEIRRIPGAFDEQLSLLSAPATAPRYIVAAQDFDYRGLDADGALRSLIAQHYILETTIDGIPLYRRIN